MLGGRSERNTVEEKEGGKHVDSIGGQYSGLVHGLQVDSELCTWLWRECGQE